MKTMQKGMLLTISLTLTTAVAYAEIYKSVDENGNVVFTDRPPTPGAQPMELRGLTVVPVPEPATPKPVRARQEQADEQGVVRDLGALRRGYRDISGSRSRCPNRCSLAPATGPPLHGILSMRFSPAWR